MPTPLISTRAKASSPRNGYCSMWACRECYDDFFADVYVAGIWGYGDEQLGRMDGVAEIQLAGAQSWSQLVNYQNTRATTDVILTGDLLNAAPGAEGDQIPGKFSLYNMGNVPSLTYRRWDPNGYKSYDNTMWDHSQVHQWSFSAEGYPGYWYIWAKSTCMKTDDKTTYRFYDNAEQVPANPEAGGYRQ
jgi:hypothetical protein